MFEDAHLETEYEDRVSGPDWAQASDTEDPWEDDDSQAIRDVQDEYEMETGVRPSYDVASVYLDRQREADSYREDLTDEDLERLVKEENESIAAGMALMAQDMDYREEVALCDAGLCDHYTCTEGQSLAEWERGQIER